MAEPDYQSQTNMSLGLHLEPYLLDRLEAGLIHQGWTLERDVLLTLRVENGQLTGKHWPAMPAERWKDLVDPERDVTGHADAVLRNLERTKVIILDTKTTVWDLRRGENWKKIWVPNKGFRESYQIQVSSYTVPFLKEGAEYSALFEFNKGGVDTRTGWVKYDDWKDVVLTRYYEVLGRTGISSPEPLVGPNEWTVSKGQSWACGYFELIKDGENAGKSQIRKPFCEYYECPNNVVNRVKLLGTDDAPIGLPRPEDILDGTPV